jgi:hypothetical protein
MAANSPRLQGPLEAPPAHTLADCFLERTLMGGAILAISLGALAFSLRP